jgi:hypothetical protein
VLSSIELVSSLAELCVDRHLPTLATRKGGGWKGTCVATGRRNDRKLKRIGEEAENKGKKGIEKRNEINHFPRNIKPENITAGRWDTLRYCRGFSEFIHEKDEA